MRWLEEAKNATWEEFAEVWNDLAKLETAMSFLLCVGTEHIRHGNDDAARDVATFIRYLEQDIAIELHHTQAFYNLPKLDESYAADVHSLVKFFRHRIPCSCLDDKYEEVKNIPKMGFCYNPKCTIPNRETERSKAKYCSRCRYATYCSRECQEADWTIHKLLCDKAAILQAKFKAVHPQT